MRRRKLNLSGLQFRLWLFFLAVFSMSVYGQEKNRVRIKADYVKVMNSQSYLNIGVISRIERQMQSVPDIELEVYYEHENEEFPLGSATTDMNGDATFILPSLAEIKADSTGTYTLGVAFGGNESFRRGSRSVSFKDAIIKTELLEKDSTNYIKATLTHALDSMPLVKSLVRVQVQRLIRPLKIGEDFNYTDENGTILVPVEEGIPGPEGILTLEVVLPDSDDFGTVKAITEAPIGVPIVKDNSFNERSLWAPRDRTPYFILIFTILLLLFTWGPILYLVRNLYKIYKSQ
ncbi:MAG: hypothetical protein KJO16_05900 [Muriicola sp.]|nr:hypothetical protein [Muriicola sp.]NNK11510.1 hypothetical protein [Flavobacteriaceae bacterium]